MEGFNINGKILIGIDHGYGNMKTDLKNMVRREAGKEMNQVVVL